MSKVIHKKKSFHWPTLNTVIMVEKTLKGIGESVVSVAELKRNIPKQINHNTLMIILKYLEESNKIFTSLHGITWIHNPNPSLRKAISEGLEI